MFLLFAACARETYDVADLQVDVTAPLPAAAENLRMCVSEHGDLRVGAGNGRMAFTGIRADTQVVVTLDVLDEDGALIASMAPASLGPDVRYTTTALLDPAEPCTAEGDIAEAGADTWLLALRFEE